MKLKFHKYHGTGNDFILIDQRDQTSIKPGDQPLIERLCHRNFGIGADGLILLEDASIADFKMIYFNSDGYQSSMCGNGGRCIVAFANELGIVRSEYSFEAIDGLHKAWILENGMTKLKMQDVEHVKRIEQAFVLNTGSPHYVQFKDLSVGEEFIFEARKIRNTDPFAEKGINVNEVQLTGSHSIKMRTYERGVEWETLSCGTGVVASAIASALYSGNTESRQHWNINTRGGNLEVDFEIVPNGSFQNVFLTGPAKCVYRGQIEI